jgi:hypothetical protein
MYKMNITFWSTVSHKNCHKKNIQNDLQYSKQSTVNLLVQDSQGNMETEKVPTSINKLNFSAFWDLSSLEFQTSVT